jgi:hypothetical protein
MFKNLRSLFTFKVIFGAIIFAGVVFAILVGILWSGKANSIALAPATAILNVIEAPTSTPIAPMVTPTLMSTPASSQQAPPPSEDIAVGDYVQVSGTGGDGLRLHETAGVSSKVQYVAIDTEVFTVNEGPVEADGYVWWLLHDPYTDKAAGWGVSNYLVVVQNP